MKLKLTLLSALAAMTVSSCAQTEEVPAQVANIQVDASLIRSEQNPWFYGGNNIYPGGAQGLMDPKTKEFDQRTLQLSALLGLRTYRFPGGSEANLYKWKRAIGEKRIDNVSGNYQMNRSNAFGPDEFGRLLETSSFDQGVIMVAWGYETPEDAADWVEYMNSPVGANPNGGIDWAEVRAKNGHPKPYNIKVWEIGNEVYGNWELNWGSYPPRGDAERGTGNVEFDQETGKAGTLPFGPADRYIHGGYQYFQQQKAVSLTSWKEKQIKSNGKPNQSFYVKFAPVSLEQADKPFKLVINGETWQRVDSFKESGPESQHYLLEPVEGKIIFGNGKQGKIPAKEQFVYLDYLSGKQPGFIDYYEKMKAVDPSITILSCFEKESFYQLMAEAKKPYDGVVKHYYPWMPKNAEPNDFYKYSIHKGLNIAKPIHEHFEWLHKYPNPAITGKEKLWLTEYGTKGHIEQQVILQTVINEFPDKVGALLGHSLYLNNNTPMIDDHGVIRSRAYPLAVFSQHSEQFFVETQVQAPTAYQYKKNAIPAVLVTASVDQSRSHLSLVLTNTSPEKSVQVQVQLNGFKPDPKQKVELWKLASTTDKVIDFNSKEKPDAVVLEKVTDLSLSEALAVEVEKAAIYILHFKGTA